MHNLKCIILLKFELFAEFRLVKFYFSEFNQAILRNGYLNIINLIFFLVSMTFGHNLLVCLRPRAIRFCSPGTMFGQVRRHYGP